jgi:hypothetical protein
MYNNYSVPANSKNNIRDELNTTISQQDEELLTLEYSRGERNEVINKRKRTNKRN